MMIVPKAVRSWMCRACAAWLVLSAAFLLAAPGRAEADRDALWKIVHNLCVPNEEHNGKPTPCTVVNLTDGYALLKDLVGATQFLLIPTTRVAGIESPDVLAPDAPNYFAFAWQSRTYIERAVHVTLPRDDVSLAVNSMYGRSQNLLHIHIDCVRSDVRHILHAAEPLITDTWAPLPVPLRGHAYLAMRVAGEQLSANPFKLLADGVPGARDAMGYHTLVVVGAIFADGQDGFIILDGRADAATGNTGSGEELQDHTCTS